ncbi:MAG: 30S ribosomal protein S17 [Candidatus Gracilibacteria bacterium]
MTQNQAPQIRTKKGVVLSTKMDKTIVVKVDTYKVHPKYQKRYKISKKFYAHDENNECASGQVVVIKETRPLSKLKRWELVEVVK